MLSLVRPLTTCPLHGLKPRLGAHEDKNKDAGACTPTVKATGNLAKFLSNSRGGALQSQTSQPVVKPTLLPVDFSVFVQGIMR